MDQKYNQGQGWGQDQKLNKVINMGLKHNQVKKWTKNLTS